MKKLFALCFACAFGALAQTNTNTVVAWNPPGVNRVPVPAELSMLAALTTTNKMTPQQMMVAIKRWQATGHVFIGTNRVKWVVGMPLTGSNYWRTGTAVSFTSNALYAPAVNLTNLLTQLGIPRPWTATAAIPAIQPWVAISPSNSLPAAVAAVAYWNELRAAGYDLNTNFPPAMLPVPKPIFTRVKP